VRWVVAGHGDVVVRRVVPALRELGEDVVGLCGRDAGRAAAVARSLGVPRSAAGLLDAADAVYVATPVVDHVRLAAAAVRAGRHVVVEKPVAGALAADPADLAALTGARPVVAVAYYRRLAPALRRLRERLAGEVVREVRVDFRTPFDPVPDDPKHWRTVRAVSGGGVLADAGSHRVDLLCWLFGRPSAVRGELSDHFPGGAERCAQLHLDWPGDVRARLRLEWAPGPPRDRLEVVFARGRAVLDPLDAGTLVWHDGSGVHAEHRPGPANAHVPLLADAVRAARDGTRPACPPAAGLLVDEVIRAVSGRGSPVRWP
jgi:predicted dehydrogenase